MTGMIVLAVGACAALVYSLVRAVLDLRGRRYRWAGAGLAVSVLLSAGLLAPVRTHAVKVDVLPADR